MHVQDNGRGRDHRDELAGGMMLAPEEELAFIDSDERLPWLEADDEVETGGVDTGRIVGFAVLGLLVLVALLGTLWWFFREAPDAAVVADGSVIEAPEEPFKTRPDSPGGREVVGTGDTRFLVAEGRQTESRLAETRPSTLPRRQDDEVQAGGDEADAGGVGVQVGAYSNRAAAETGWGVLRGRYTALEGQRHRVVEGVVDGATVYRLQAVAADEAAADALCDSLKAEGGDCQVKR